MKIFVTRNIPQSGLLKLETAGHSVVVNSEDRALTHAELLTKLQAENPDAVICLLTDQVDAEVLAAAPNAKIFANYAVGFDNIDTAAAKKLGVEITNTPDVLSEAVAEHTVALILAIARRIVESDRFLRDGRYQGWDPLLLLGTELQGKTLGIVGSGRIGERVAEIMRLGFKMNISYFDQQPNETLDTKLSASFVADLNELLKQSDIISLHLPLTPSTRYLIDAERLTKLKPTALLINTARGAIVNEKDLVAALKDKYLAGAALDVFENEPEIHPELLTLPNVVLTPHTASATLEARERMSILAADNILAVFNKKTPPNSVL